MRKVHYFKFFLFFLHFFPKPLLGEHARFITGTDLLIDGGVIASIRTGEFKLWQ